MTKREIPEDAIKNQTAASNPQSSAWVSANAGSGKTHVLTFRGQNPCFDVSGYQTFIEWYRAGADFMPHLYKSGRSSHANAHFPDSVRLDRA